MRIITNTMGIIIVFRFRHVWLFNLTLSHNLYNGVTRMLRISFPLVLAMLTLVLIGCDGNPLASNDDSQPPKPHYHYLYSPDTLYKGDWADSDTLQLHHDSTWTTATVYAYQDTVKITIASLSFKTPYATSSKPAYWNGQTVALLLSRLPMAWDKVVVRFTNKVEVK